MFMQTTSLSVPNIPNMYMYCWSYIISSSIILQFYNREMEAQRESVRVQKGHPLGLPTIRKRT